MDRQNRYEPLHWGWPIHQGSLVPLLTHLSAVKELLEVIMCKCKTGCATLKCIARNVACIVLMAVENVIDFFQIPLPVKRICMIDVNLMVSLVNKYDFRTCKDTTVCVLKNIKCNNSRK